MQGFEIVPIGELHQRAEQWRDRIQGCGIQGLSVGSRSGED
jgi:hypothetical protein